MRQLQVWRRGAARRVSCERSATSAGSVSLMALGDTAEDARTLYTLYRWWCRGRLDQRLLGLDRYEPGQMRLECYK